MPHTASNQRKKRQEKISPDKMKAVTLGSKVCIPPDLVPSHPILRYLRKEYLPNIWCAGCGIGVVVNAFAYALKQLNFGLDRLAVVSGIGCSGRASGYINADSFHTTHGRAIPVATGIKIAKPDLKVAVISGDGDLFAIGGNHFIHAARRNLDITVICINNFSYGMTGCQYGPTTPNQAITTTSRYGLIEHPFNLVQLAAGAGAVYVARWTVYHARQLQKSIAKAMQKNGFSFVEAISPCPTYFERYNKLGDHLDALRRYKEISVVKRGVSPEDAVIDYKNRIVCGEFVDIEKPEYTDQLKALIAKAKKDAQRQAILARTVAKRED
ncbi:MAG: thiamine pyrophosphate-dependent enzyme [Candidatus Ranarchaeia archaeon]